MCFLKRIIRYLFFPSVLVILMTGIDSCSVKEERGDCLTWVSLSPEVDIPDSLQGALALFICQEGAQDVFVEHSIDDLLGGLTFTLRRRPVELAGVIGWPREGICGNVLRIPLGSDCPEAIGFSESVIIDAETEEISLGESLVPLYADVNVSVLGAHEDYPYGLVVEGDVDGYLLASLEPHHGPFLCAPDAVVEDRGRSISCRVPRQDNTNLSVSLVRREVSPSTKGEGDDLGYVYSLPLGVILEEEGYDWNSETLESISVSIDFAATQIVVSAAGWTKVLMMDDKYVI